MYGDFILLSLQHPGRVTCAVGEKKCAVFAQFWEVIRSKISHNTIDNQCGSLKLRSNKKIAQLDKIVRCIFRWAVLSIR